MADDQVDPSLVYADPPAEDYTSIADQVSAGVLKNLPLDAIRDMLVAAVQQGVHAALTSAIELLPELGVVLAKGVLLAEEPIMPLVGGFASTIVSGMFNTPEDAAAFASRGNRAARGDAAGAIVEAFMAAVAGDAAASDEPSDAGAIRIARAAVHATIEGWFQGLVADVLQSLIPFDIGHVEDFSKIGEEVIRALGMGRLVRRAFAPLITAAATTPLQWKVHKQYRQTMYSAGEAVDLFFRGKLTEPELQEELSRLGWAQTRIEGLKELHSKPSPLTDMIVLVREGLRTREDTIQKLLDQGWDNGTAELVVSAEEIRRLAGIRDDAFGAIRSAYVDRRIGDAELSNFMPTIFPSDADRAAHEAALRTIRDLNTKRLTPGQVEACVKAQILPIAAYRDVLRLDGYDEEAVLALELLLETQLNKEADLETLRQEKIAQLAAEKTARADAAAQKLVDVEQQRALARRGSLAELQRAVVRGLIPTSRYREILDAHYDGDTVATLVALVEQERAAYVAQQQKAEDATKHATIRHIDAGALTAAYLDGVLTLDQVRGQLLSLSFDAGDTGVLLATMQARKADLDAAKAQRADAAARAKAKTIDLNREEALVRRGHATIAQYTALLTSLGFNDGSVAAMVDLLQLRIADDQAARQAREALAAKNAAQGLSLDQIRRAVILQISTIDDVQRYLVAHKFTADAQAVLLAELRADVAQADAARAKRTAAETAQADKDLPLATAARAARLGLITPAAYQARLVDAGYTPDDVAIETDLLAVEIATTQAARARQAAVKPKPADRGLTLDQIAKAVKLDDATIDDYRARAVELGYAADDVDTLVSVLEDAVQTIHDAHARHAAIDGQLHARNLSLAELDQAVTAGQMTIGAYTARLLALGFGADDAQLLTTLLDLRLPAAPAGG